MPEKEEEKTPEITIPDEELEKPPEGYTQDEWNGLSRGEKEGIIGGMGTPADETEKPDIDEDTLKEIAGEEETPKPGEKPKEEKPAEAKPAEEKPKEEAKAEEKKPEEKPAETAKPAEEAAKVEVKAEEKPATGEALSDEQLLRFRPAIKEEDLPPIDTVPPEIQKKLDDLDEKYDGGDMTLKDYNKERDKINRELTYHNLSARESVKAEKVWDAQQTHFLINRPEYIEKSAKGSALYGALNETVSALSTDPKYAGFTGMELLIEADRIVKETFGWSKPKAKESEKPAETKTEEKKEEKKEAKVEEKPKVEAKPPAKAPDNKTLGEIPNAAPMTIGSGWEALDKLEGAAYEAALEKLTPEQRDRYLNAR